MKIRQVFIEFPSLDKEFIILLCHQVTLSHDQPHFHTSATLFPYENFSTLQKIKQLPFMVRAALNVYITAHCL